MTTHYAPSIVPKFDFIPLLVPGISNPFYLFISVLLGLREAAERHMSSIYYFFKQKSALIFK